MMRPGDWRCPVCSDINFASRSQCRKCGKGVKPPSAAIQPKPGDWTCACGTLNFANKVMCFRCQRPKSVDIPCAQPATITSEPLPRKPGDWDCPHCGKMNFASRQACFQCQTPRVSMTQMGPTGGILAASSPTPMRPGDWLCPQCGTHNFGTRIVCLACANPRESHTPKPEAEEDSESAEREKFFQTPQYWELATPQGSIYSLHGSAFFSKVVESLWKSAGSRVSDSHPVTAVQRIENQVLWYGYRAEVQRLAVKHPNQCRPIEASWQPTTLCVLQDEFHINEVYLMHGTSPDVGKLIMEGGFDPSHSGESAGALFGQGTYFSDSLQKVMGYSRGCIIVARVALGHPAVPPFSSTPSGFRRPPPTPDGGEYDSVIARASSNAPKEFIVYRHTKAYPEYVIFHG